MRNGADEPSDHPVFVGRQTELDVLHHAVERARDRQPQVVIVEGDAGMGKTLLMDALLGRTMVDAVVLRARGDEAEAHLALGIVSQLVLTGATGPGPAVVPPILEERSSDLDPLVAGAQLLSFVGTLEAGHNLVIIAVDDAHLADISSTRALVFAARRFLADRVLVLLTSRSGELDAGWSQFIGGSRGRSFLLGGLTAAELQDLAAKLGTPLGTGAAEQLWRATDGHPLSARALLASRAPTPSAATAGSSAPPPPPALAAIVLAQLERCPADARALVRAAAVLGRRCQLVDAMTVGEVQGPATALGQAAAARLLAEDAALAGRELRFPHALVHAAVYNSLSPAERTALHRHAAQITRGDISLRHRLAATLGCDERLAADLEALARDEIRSGALVAGAEHMRQASTVSSPGLHRDRRLLEAVETWLIAGEASPALALEAEVRAGTPGTYREHVLGYLALVGGRLSEAKEAFLRAWAALSADETVAEHLSMPEDLAGRIAVCMAVLVVINLDTAEVPYWIEACERHAVADGRSASFSWFCRALGMGAYGRASEALRLLASSDAPDTADILAVRGMLELWTDEYVRAREHLAVAFARARNGEPVRVTQALGFLAEAEYRLGRFDEAAVHAELAVQAAHDAGRVWDLPLLHSLAAYPNAARGDLEVAEIHARAAEDWAAMAPIPGFRGYAANARTAVSLARGDVASLLEAARLVDAAYELVDPGTTVFGPVLAEALLELGRTSEAERALHRYEAKAKGAGRRSAMLGGWRARGLLEALRNNHAAAAIAFEHGEVLGAALDLPLERGRLIAARGRALGLAGRHLEAREQLEHAIRVFEGIGARAYAAITRAHLGVLQPARSADYRSGLSATEAMIARLVADGLSNREIAEQLVVSVKAVEYHLTNVYRRLGFSSRVKLAQLVGPPRPGDG